MLNPVYFGTRYFLNIRVRVIPRRCDFALGTGHVSSDRHTVQLGTSAGSVVRDGCVNFPPAMADFFKMMHNPLLAYKPMSHFLGPPLVLMASTGSSGSDSGSPSPPVTPGKSFTIDSILGLHQPPAASAIDYSNRSLTGQCVASCVIDVVLM